MSKGPFLPLAVGWGCVPWRGPDCPVKDPTSQADSVSGMLPGLKIPSRKSGIKILSDEYRARLKRPDWIHEISPRIKKRANFHCEKCGIKSGVLEVHHLTYERFGEELDSDLQALCPACHDKADAQRKLDFARASEARKEDHDFERWLVKRYGKFGSPPENAREIFEEERDLDDE